MYRVLLIEKICKLGNTYCCSYFFNKKNESGIHLFHMLIDLLLYCTDYGVQMSACGIIEELIGHDPIMSVRLILNGIILDGRFYFPTSVLF